MLDIVYVFVLQARDCMMNLVYVIVFQAQILYVWILCMSLSFRNQLYMEIVYLLYIGLIFEENILSWELSIRRSVHSIESLRNFEHWEIICLFVRLFVGILQ